MNKISNNLKLAYNLNNWENNYIFECGAGAHAEETAELRCNNNCYYMEPNPEYYNTSKNHINIFNYALADYDGETEFNITSHIDNSSIKHSSEHLDELKLYNTTYTKIKINCVTYLTFIKHILKHTVDVLILDVEGYEVNILKTFINLEEKDKPKIIVIECGYDWEERLQLLKQLNYNLDFYYFNNAYLTLNNLDNIIKDCKQIKIFKNEWKSWSWQGKIIYDDSNL